MKRTMMILAIALAIGAFTACSTDDPLSTDDTTETEDSTDDDTDDSDDSDDDDDDDDGTDDDPSGTGDDTDPEVTDDNDTSDVLNVSDFTTDITITWDGSTATVSGADDVIDYSVDGGYVTLGTSSSEVEGLNITLSGSSSAGSLKIYNSKKILLTMNGVSLTSGTGAAINSQCSKRTFVLLKDGTTNTLADASSYSDVSSDEDCKGTFFSEGQIIFSGTGRLNVKGNYKHGIASDDYIRVMEGTVYVTGAATDGIHVNDYLRVDDGTLNVTASGDGIEAEEGYVNIVGGDITVSSVDDGISASYSGTDSDIYHYINIAGGTVNVTTSGQKGQGINATGDVIVSDGTVKVTVNGSGSKAIKSDNNVVISGGTLTLNTTGSSFYDTDDSDTSSPSCIRAENNVTISGGDVIAKSTGSGAKGVNCYAFTITDGSISATTTGSQYTYGSYSCKPKAIKASNLITISGGEVTVKTSGSEAEGIESKGNINVTGGYVIAQTYDDCINAAGIYNQSGGYVYAYATNNDGLDSNYGGSGAITISGGVVIAHGATSPEEGIDVDNLQYIVFKGGTIFTSGGQMSMGSGNPSCSQPTLCVQGYSLSKGYFTVTDSDGEVIMSCYVPRAMSNCSSYISSSSFTSGSTYSYGVVSSAPTSPTTSWSTLYYSGGTISGTLSSSFTASSGYSSTGSSSTGGGNQGGNAGGGPGW